MEAVASSDLPAVAAARADLESMYSLSQVGVWGVGWVGGGTRGCTPPSSVHTP